jgi:sensor domain CHASE-containing protein
MRIRTRTLLLIGGMTLGLLAIVYAVSASLFLGRFRRLEQREARRGLEQARNALAGSWTSWPSSITTAAWDDTYDFIRNQDPEYLKSNLMDETFSGGRLNLMLFLDREGGIAYAKSFDWRRGQRLAVPGMLAEYLRLGGPLVTGGDLDEHTAGILLLPEEPLLIAAHPILTSTSLGPSRGTLLMGRYLGAAELSELAEQTRLELRITRLDHGEPEELSREARDQLLREGSLVQALDRKRIAAYAVLPDVRGQAALVLRSVIPREVYAQGLTGVRYLVLSCSCWAWPSASWSWSCWRRRCCAGFPVSAGMWPASACAVTCPRVGERKGRADRAGASLNTCWPSCRRPPDPQALTKPYGPDPAVSEWGASWTPTASRPAADAAALRRSAGPGRGCRLPSPSAACGAAGGLARRAAHLRAPPAVRRRPLDYGAHPAHRCRGGAGDHP